MEAGQVSAIARGHIPATAISRTHITKVMYTGIHTLGIVTVLM